MTVQLANLISNVLNLDPFGYSTNTMKIVIEEKLEEAKNNTLEHIGKRLISEDIVITKEENNQLFSLENLHTLFIEEMKEELEIINN